MQQAVNAPASYKPVEAIRYPRQVTQRLAARLAPGLVFAASLLVCVLGFGVYYDRACEAATAQALASLDRDLAREGWSAGARQMAGWAIRTNDHRGLPFVVIDQTHARLFAFDALGRLAASAQILSDPVGAAGWAPAGRLVADTRRSARLGTIVWANDHDVLWVDPAPPNDDDRFPIAAAFHHHAGRALHVPSEFYREHLHALRQQASIAYVLPGEPEMHRSSRSYAVRRVRGPNRSRSPS